MTLLRELSTHAKTLCPGAIQHKDFADMMIHIESFVKQEGGGTGASLIDKLQQFLNGEPETPNIPDAPQGPVN